MVSSAPFPPRQWSILQPLPAPILVEMAKQAEARGIHGCFAPQVMGPPFLPLAVAAGVTERLQLASGIAIAAVRSPFETAMAAIDMDRISGGRFILGLGASVLAWSRGIFGAPEHKPLAHLRETVEAVRHIVRVPTGALRPSRASTIARTSSSCRRPRRRCARRSRSGSRRSARRWCGWRRGSPTG